MPNNMLTKIVVKNFKSLLNTEIILSKNSFLIGVNGTGKTSILQVIDFLSVISQGEGAIESWLKERGWDKNDLTFYGTKKTLIELEIDFNIEGQSYRWNMAFNSRLLKCRMEKIVLLAKKRNNAQELLMVDSGFYSILKGKKEKINFKYTGSIISGLKKDILGEVLTKIHTFFTEIRSAELLSPILMKKKAREAHDGIGLGGEKLSAFLNGLHRDKQEIIQQKLTKFFPQIETFETSSLRSGWKKLSIIEHYRDTTIVTESTHLSDGILRILAILAQLETTESVLVFDEIEDGINQEFVEKLVDVLIDSPHQTIIATHSPMLLNYLDDSIAEKSILFVYKTKEGATKVKNFFEVLKSHQIINDYEHDLFGPGELMQRVNLVELTEKIRVDE